MGIQIIKMLRKDTGAAEWKNIFILFFLLSQTCHTACRACLLFCWKSFFANFLIVLKVVLSFLFRGSGLETFVTISVSGLIAAGLRISSVIDSLQEIFNTKLSFGCDEVSGMSLNSLHVVRRLYFLTARRTDHYLFGQPRIWKPRTSEIPLIFLEKRVIQGINQLLLTILLGKI